MLITEILARNARAYGNEIALVERDPAKNSRREITWEQFDAEANRVANALIAIDHGLEHVQGTINGIGERAGNTAMEEVVMALRQRPDVFGVETTINTKEITRTSRMVSAKPESISSWASSWVRRPAAGSFPGGGRRPSTRWTASATVDTVRFSPAFLPCN